MSGLWLNETDFMHFGDAPAPLSEQIATRSRSLDWQSLSGILPNPDTVLRRMGKSIQVYRDLRPDVDVGNGIRRRKAAVASLERGLDRNMPKTAISKSVWDMMKDWDWDNLLGEIQNAALFGYSPLEIVWEKSGKYLAPVQLIAKPPEWFTYDTNNELRFLSKNAPFNGEMLIRRNFVCARQEPSYINPYGFPDLSMCFWPAIFRKGGMKFWVTFTEKFGMPWVIGKSPRGTQRLENRDLLNNLYSMVQDAVAVIPDDSSVEIMQGIGAGSNGDQYEKFIKICTRDINVALVGQNQTTESDTNRASATSGHEVIDSIRNGHKSIICATINTVIDYVCELNYDTNERPRYAMWEQEAINVQIAERDLKLFQAGAMLSPQYFARTYNLQPGDQVETKTPQAEFADPDEPETVPEMDAIDAAIDGITTRAPLTAEMQAMLNPLFAAIKNGVKPDELMAMLTDIYRDMDTAGLQERLARAIFVSKLWGKINALD
jgi:phage gp29-like protein